MSATAIRYRQGEQKMCLGCGVRPALFFVRGHLKRDRKHNLCWRCWRVALSTAVRELRRQW